MWHSPRLPPQMKSMEACCCSLRSPFSSPPAPTSFVSTRTSSPLSAWKHACYFVSPVSLPSIEAKARHVKVLTRGGRRGALYEDANTYVLIEPGQDEEFVSVEELKVRLIKWLENWPEELPLDLSKYDSLEEAVSYLVRSVCELDLGGGLGSIQWFEVGLD